MGVQEDLSANSPVVICGEIIGFIAFVGVFLLGLFRYEWWYILIVWVIDILAFVMQHPVPAVAAYNRGLFWRWLGARGFGVFFAAAALFFIGRGVGSLF